MRLRALALALTARVIMSDECRPMTDLQWPMSDMRLRGGAPASEKPVASATGEARELSMAEDSIRVSPMQEAPKEMVPEHVQKMRDREGQRILDVIGRFETTPEVFKMKIRGVRDINYQNDTGCHALWACCWHAQPELARICLEAGANVDLANNGGSTPLMLACSTGCEKMVELLLAHDAFVDAVSPDGHTALSNSINHPRIVQMLLAKGANRTIKCKGQTLLEMAKQPSMMYSEARSVTVQILHEADQQDLLREIAERRAHMEGMRWPTHSLTVPAFFLPRHHPHTRTLTRPRTRAPLHRVPCVPQLIRRPDGTSMNAAGRACLTRRPS